jgi:hypothetical protein
MKMQTTRTKTIAVVVAIASIAVTALTILHSPANAAAKQNDVKGTVVAYPWVFHDGNHTSRMMAITTAEEIGRKADYSSVPHDVARSDWRSGRFPRPSFGRLPSDDTLAAFGRSVHATTVLYGSVAWRTRSIWVGLGPKTISTATVDAYVFDVSSGRTIYTKLGVEGRSDEREDAWKVAADVLITPIVSAVSGGPATPREQRAVQIAMARAYHAWVRGN